MCVVPGCSGHTRLICRLRRFEVKQCQSCGIRFRDPFPTQAEIEAMYDDEAYHASAYFDQSAGRRHGRLTPEHRISLEALGWLAARAQRDGHDRGRLLDLGCGTGFFLSLAREHGWDVEGVELSKRLSASARTDRSLTIYCGDFLETPIEPGSFDVVTMWDFLEHVLDPLAVLLRARSLLKTNGILVIFTIDTSGLFNLLGDLAYRASGGALSRPAELLYDARHNYYFTQASLGQLVARCGLRVEARAKHRAYLGRWLSEPAPWWLRVAGGVVDAASVLAGRQYRQLIYCAPSPSPLQ